jgi:hypothetical protein
MGRGLSELQRWIVQEASHAERLYFVEILERYFHWEAYDSRAPYYWSDEDKKQNHTLKRCRVNCSCLRFGGVDRCTKQPGELLTFHGQTFSRARIGEQRYRSVMVTLTRSVNRLVQRGLIQRLYGSFASWRALTITDQGREWLSANSPSHETKS